RETDSALIKVATLASQGANGGFEKKDQYEKFLFYRGLGSFPLPLTVKSTARSSEGLGLQLTNQSARPLEGLFAVQVENQTIRFGAVENIAGHGSLTCALPATLGKPMPLAEGVPAVKQAVAHALVEAGLYHKEADAMVNTWEKSYFRTDGLRVL